MFLVLGGREFCYYPYYNFKNTIHPSYQIHPFMWNLVEKTGLQDLVRETFYSHNVTELEEERAASYIDNILGEYGQVIDKWRYPDVWDFSGYTSRYEKSRHSPGTMVGFSEVVDYDGPFYPPAIEYLVRNGTGSAVSSLVGGHTSETIKDSISDDPTLKRALSGYAQSPTDQKAGEILSSLSWVSLVTEVSESQLSSAVWKYLSETNSMDLGTYGLGQAVGNLVGSTFFERFYYHLQMSQDKREYVAS